LILTNGVSFDQACRVADPAEVEERLAKLLDSVEGPDQEEVLFRIRMKRGVAVPLNH
jgi:hypothetical protein